MKLYTECICNCGDCAVTNMEKINIFLLFNASVCKVKCELAYSVMFMYTMHLYLHTVFGTRDYFIAKEYDTNIRTDVNEIRSKTSVKPA